MTLLQLQRASRCLSSVGNKSAVPSAASGAGSVLRRAAGSAPWSVCIAVFALLLANAALSVQLWHHHNALKRSQGLLRGCAAQRSTALGEAASAALTTEAAAAAGDAASGALRAKRSSGGLALPEQPAAADSAENPLSAGTGTSGGSSASAGEQPAKRLAIKAFVGVFTGFTTHYDKPQYVYEARRQASYRGASVALSGSAFYQHNS